MNRIVIAALALAAALPMLANAHGPSRKKEISTIEIDAPADKVWEVVGNYRDMGWHPQIDKTEADPGEYKKEVTKRKLTFKNGAIFTDTLTRYEPENKTIAFLTNDEDLKTLPVEGYSSTISVADEGGKSKVEWKGAFYRGYMNNDPPPELSDKAAIAAVTAFQKEGLEALKAKLEGGK
ncbi:mxaD protein [Hyphomicrobium sp. 1Nfss2.1]